MEALRLAAYDLDKSLQSKDYKQLTKQIEKLNFEIDQLLTWSEEHDLDILFETENLEGNFSLTK